ncbi:MAG: hypothetical protein D6795_12085, partial [Deltaproteobacteria bacterium]
RSDPYLAQYAKVERIGEGGMGMIFKCFNQHLNRHEAVKCLHKKFAENENVRKRLVLEARALADVVHPSVIRVYDARHVKGGFYIAMEFIEGVTLREYMANRTLSIEEIHDLAIQICDALAAVHDRGIIHRDIKPENIMVQKDGKIKILDFGLAKYLEPVTLKTEISIDLSAPPKTLETQIVGTPYFMSPEQITGKRLDPRTDIFSVGIVLYKMIWNRLPFRGATFMELSREITDADPPSEPDDRPIPFRLERILFRALEKKPADRFASFHEMAEELRESKRHLRPIDDRIDPILRAWYRRTHHLSREELERWFRIGAISLLALLAGAWALWHFYIRTKVFPTQWEHVQLTHWENSLEEMPAISPDGRWVAFVSNRTGDQEVYVQRLEPDAPAIRLTHDPESDIFPAWSPDGKTLYFSSNRYDGMNFDLWRVNPEGSEKPERFIENAFNLALSPSGNRVAFTRIVGENLRIFVQRVRGGEARQVTDGTKGEGNHLFPTWSPDGRTLAYVVEHKFLHTRQIWVLDLVTGIAHPLTGEEGDADMPHWRGKWIYYISTEGGKRDIWRVDRKGHRERITSGPGERNSLSITRNARRIVYNTDFKRGNLYLYDPAGEREIQFTRSSGIEKDPSWSPDGKWIVFAYEQKGEQNLWKRALEKHRRSGPPQRLTRNHAIHRQPVWSPDGKWIAFVSEKEGRSDIWIVSPDGEIVFPLLQSPADEVHPAWSPDGKWLAFARKEGGNFDIWKIPMEEGHAAG